MIPSREEFVVESESTGELYHVTFINIGETVTAHCTCPAGEKNTLCKHILKCVDENPGIKYELTQCGLWQIYEEHLLLLKESEKLKREAKNVKKKFSRLLLSGWEDWEESVK